MSHQLFGVVVKKVCEHPQKILLLPTLMNSMTEEINLQYV